MAAAAEASAAPSDMGAILARIATPEAAPQPAVGEPAATAGGQARAPGMQQLMALLQQPAAAPPPHA